MFRNNPYMVRSEQLVKSHERIDKAYVTKDAKTLQRWCTFSDKVLLGALIYLIIKLNL